MSNIGGNDKNNSGNQKNYNHRNCLKCDVCNCIHNDQNCGCTAKEIVVGPDFASSQSDTVCGTFQKSKF